MMNCQECKHYEIWTNGCLRPECHAAADHCTGYEHNLDEAGVPLPSPYPLSIIPLSDCAEN
jgi:hypothetical protein